MESNPFYITDEQFPWGRGEFYFFHGKAKTRSGAYEIQESARLVLKIPRSLGTSCVTVNIFSEDKQERLLSIKAKYKDYVGNYDVYQLGLPIRKIGVGLYYFNVEIIGIVGTVYAQKRNGGISFFRCGEPSFQLSVSDFKYRAPVRYQGGIIYHVFVDRFCRGKGAPIKKDAIFVEDWYAPIPEFPEYPGAALKNNYFYGGTLWGISEKLSYIKSLGVNIIYLSPIFDSPSNHKYDTGDYMSVDEGFGGDFALSYLIKKAKTLGIYVILDGVFNHTGADSLYFNRYGNYESIGAYQSKSSNYYSWYEFIDYPDKYTSWWGIDILPRINPDIPHCRDFFVGNGGVVEKYAKMGISGFRLDVSDELSDSFIASIKEKLNEYNQESLLYGEVWEDASNKVAYGKRKRYYLGHELDGVMNYPVRRGIIDFLRNQRTESLFYALTDVTDNAPKRIRDIQMNLIGTHDTERIITALGGESPFEKTNEYLSKKKMSPVEYQVGKTRLLLAYTILATLPGIPSVFYGDEVGLEGYSDPFNRATFPFLKEDKEILDFFKKIGKIRRENNIYKCGEFELLYLTENLLIFSRYDKKNSYLTVINNGNNEINITTSGSSTSLINKQKAKKHKIASGSSEIIKTIKNSYIEF